MPKRWMQHRDGEGSTYFKLSLFSFQGMILRIVGVDGGEGTPVPIPNTAVKLTCADNTWLVAAREDKRAPTQRKHLTEMLGAFFLFIRGWERANDIRSYGAYPNLFVVCRAVPWCRRK